MSQQDLVVPPLSRREIRQRALAFRKIFKLENAMYFPIVEIMEIMNSMPEVFKNWNMEIASQSEMGTFHGLTLADGTVKIREDVYMRAASGVGMDRDTMAHELGHWLFHRNNRAHARIGGGSIPIYCTPEWQAKAFSGELLVSAHLVSRDMTAEYIKNACGVSYSSAQYQLSKIPRR